MLHLWDERVRGGLGGPGTAWALDDPMATLTPDTRELAHDLARLAVDLDLRHRRLRRELEGERHLPALDRQPLDQSKAHNVLPKVRVLNGPQRGQNRVFGHRPRSLSAEDVHRASAS